MRTHATELLVPILLVLSLGCNSDCSSDKGRATLVSRRVEVDRIRNSLSEYCRIKCKSPLSESELGIILKNPSSKITFNKRCCEVDFSEEEISFVLMETEVDDATVVTFVSKRGQIHSSRTANMIECNAYSSKAIYECLLTDDNDMVDSKVIDRWRLPAFGKEVTTTNMGHRSESVFEDGSRVVVVYASLHVPGRRTVYKNSKVLSDVDFTVDEYGVIKTVNSIAR